MLEYIDELEFMFTTASFVTATATDHLATARRDLFLPKAGSGVSALLGSVFEIRLRNNLSQGAIARGERLQPQRFWIDVAPACQAGPAAADGLPPNR